MTAAAEIAQSARRTLWREAGIVAVLTVVLIVVVNLGLWVYFLARDGWASSDPSCSGAGERCLVRFRVLMSRVRLSPVPVRTPTYNIDDEGWRVDTRTPAQFAGFSRDDVNVFVFGGSTLFGLGVKDDETLVVYLRDALSQQLIVGATGLRRLRVYNLGQPGYGLKDEAYLLVDQLRLGRVPTVALFYDGVNEDGAYSTANGYREADYGAGAIAAAFRETEYRPYWVLEVPMLQAARLLRPRLARRLGMMQAISLEDRPDEAIRERAAAQAASYLRSASLAAKVAAAYGVRPVFVLQPSGAFVDGWQQRRFGRWGRPLPKRVLYYTALYRQILAGQEEAGIVVHDLSRSLNGAIRERFAGGVDLFVDWQHLSAAGNQFMATQLAQTLKAYLR